MKIITYLTLLLCFFGCKPKGKFTTIKDEQLMVQAISVPGDSGLTYKVRIYPQKQWQDQKPKLTQKMQYDADSCFYLTKGNLRYYATDISPIANGMKNNFEYLVSFAALPKNETDSVMLIYHDKHLTQKDYKLLLN
jgi:hypothetical protein